MALTQALTDTISVLKQSKHVLVLPSSPIDGDSLGSALSLYLALKKLNVKVTIVAQETIPTSYNFLPEISAISHDFNLARDFIVTLDCRGQKPTDIKHEIQGDKVNIIFTPSQTEFSKEQVSFSYGPVPYDCIVTVDAADPSQLGKIYEEFTELWHMAPVINIDHHTSNPGFGKINLVDIMASSTTTVILQLIEQLDKSLIDADIATLLLAGLITDTGSFQNPNTTPDAFSWAAKLIGYGARQQEIIRHIYKTKKLSTLHLWGRALTKLQFDEARRLVWSVLTAKDFAELGGSPDETEGVIDELMSNAPGADIVLLLKEKSRQEIGGSLRTLAPSIDASKLAEMFGGGGHMQAAGFKILGKNIEQAEQEVLAGLRNFQEKRLGLAVTAMPPEPEPMPIKTEPQMSPTPTPPAVSTPPPAIPAAPAIPAQAEKPMYGDLSFLTQYSPPEQQKSPIPTQPPAQEPPAETSRSAATEKPAYPFPPQPGMLS